MYNNALQKFSPCTRVILACGKQHSIVRSTGSVCPAIANEKESSSDNIPWEDAKPFEQMPGPKALPLIGNIHRFLPIIGQYYDKEKKNCSTFLWKVNEEFGNVVRVSGLPGMKAQVFVYDPKEAEKVSKG